MDGILSHDGPRLMVVHSILATTYGRPSMLPPLKQLPTAMAQRDPQNQTSETKTMSFFASSLKLHGLMCEHITRCSGICASTKGVEAQHSDRKNAALMDTSIDMDYISDLLDLESELLTWEKELPPNLQMSPIAELLMNESLGCPPMLDRQTVVIRARYEVIGTFILSKLTARRYLHSIILAFRPLLLRRIESPTPPSTRIGGRQTMRHILASTVFDNGPMLSLQAAVELSFLIDLVHRSNRDVLPEPWYVVFCKLTVSFQVCGTRVADFDDERHVYVRHGHTGSPTLFRPP